MLRVSVAALVMAAWSLAVPALSATAPRTGALTDADPQWITKPTGDDVAKFYPPLAQAGGIGGKIGLKCQVDANGMVNACVVVSEEPKGLGFGDAAVNLSTLFRMSPKLADGRAVAGAEVSIPITFVPAEEKWALGRLVLPIEWVAQPDKAAMDRVRTPDMKNGAAAGLTCHVQTTGKEAGSLRDCEVIGEGPKGSGAGKAALALTPLFRADPATVAHALPSMKMEVALRWSRQAP